MYIKRTLVKCYIVIIEYANISKHQVYFSLPSPTALYSAKLSHILQTYMSHICQTLREIVSDISLSEQLFESTNSQILRLELENRRLKEELDALRENELLGNVVHRLEVDKENMRLGQKVSGGRFNFIIK